MLQYAGCCRIKVIEVIEVKEVIEVEESQEVQKPRSPEVETSLLKTLQFSTSVLTNGEPTAEICCSGCVSHLSYDTSGHWMVLILHTQVDIKYRGRLTEPDF